MGGQVSFGALQQKWRVVLVAKSCSRARTFSAGKLRLLGVQDLEQGEALVARKLLERDLKRPRLVPFAAGQMRQQSIQNSAVAGKTLAVRAPCCPEGAAARQRCQ